MRIVLILTSFFIAVNYSYADYLTVKDGTAYLITDASKESLTTEFVGVTKSSISATIDQLKIEGYKQPSKDEWINKINSRLKETTMSKRAREFPPLQEQLEAIWKIFLGREDALSDATKDKIKAILDNYPDKL